MKSNQKNALSTGYGVMFYLLWFAVAGLALSFASSLLVAAAFIVLMSLLAYLKSKAAVTSIQEDVMELVQSSQIMLECSKEAIARLEKQLAEATAK